MMTLDAGEYFHLALHAVRQNDHHAALQYLKQVLALEPDNAAAHYLMAAEHAELGLFDRAIQGMEEALALRPDLEIARFQLGLLHLQGNRTQQASTAFQALESMATDSALLAFARAYLALISDLPAEAVPWLEQGIAQCDNNPSLKADMNRVLDSVRQKLEPAPAESLTTSPENTDPEKGLPASVLFLGAYRDSLKDENDPH
ncbi:tetratricopeptide repeat protein [Fluviicoccus keumensis]|uniref:Tetratricopeptide repeat protein n=1 Tax=Fluviicoccus keumensis TaxID=1435465 RepID=A0A4Q7YP51_9GAMM|nr:tetratricopeptide repeat protein [Fluviicoccus keumensis]RZU38489.1 tetratricopeptide repeat protein [Fluviicoccus keumensis]